MAEYVPLAHMVKPTQIFRSVLSLHFCPFKSQSENS